MNLLVILTSVLLLGNISAIIMHTYFPELLESYVFIFPPEIILLLINSVTILYILLCYTQKKSISAISIENKPPPGINLDKNITSTGYSDRLLIENFPNILCIKDKKGRWLHATPEYLILLDMRYIDYVGKTDAFLAKRSNANKSAFNKNIAQDKRAWDVRQGIKKTISFIVGESSTTQLEVLTTPLFDKKNEPFRLIVTGQRIEQEQKNKDKLEVLKTIFFNSHLSFVILNESLNVISNNLAFSLLFGYSSSEIKNKKISYLTNTEKNKGFCENIEADFQKYNFQLWSGEVECKMKNGQIILVKIEIKPILSEKKTFDYYFVTLDDITLVKENEKRILQIAHYDFLTGLVNRAMFMDRLAQFLSAAERHKLTAIILFIDLDKFKSVNDSLGHDAGDEVLKETAKRLSAIVRKEDVVARFSGDEFALLILNEKTHGKAIYSSTMVAGKIIKNLAEVFYIKKRELFIGSSIGISIFPEDGRSSELLLKNADIAMYEAKNKGRNNYQFYKKEFSTASKDRIALENDLRKAMVKGEFQLYYQPQYDTQSRVMSGAEVLIRWFQDPYGANKMIPPDHFIPIAEETGLIIEMGAWILETACYQLKVWLNLGYSIPQVSVNVSARQFMDEGFLQSVEEALKKADLEAKYLELEITESMLIGDLNKIELQLTRLKKMGIKIALDDFGTGYSSLSYLKRFPIDILKIDQSFIRELTIGSKEASIACAIIKLGHSLNQKVVAEGVENETQLMFLSERKCDFIQGYYFSPPLPVYKMSTLLNENSTGGRAESLFTR